MQPAYPKHMADPAETIRKRRRWLLAILAALGVHVCILLALSQVALFMQAHDEDEIVFKARLVNMPEPLKPPEPPGRPEVPPAPVEAERPAVANAGAQPGPAAPQPEVERPAAPRLPVAQVGPATKPASIYAGRSVAGKARALKQFGGTPGSEAAVHLGLEWLARHQKPEGYWSDGERGVEAGISGLALLAFLGAGNTQTRGKYADNVSRAVDYLVTHQEKDGRFGVAARHQMYSQGIAVLALSEAMTLSHDPTLGLTLQRGVDYIVAAQQTGGGWDYTHKQTTRNDTSISCWQIMALASARRAGADAPRKTLRRAIDFLDAVTLSSGRVQYLRRKSRTSSALTAAAAFCRLLLGWDRDALVVRRSVDHLARHMPNWKQSGIKGMFPIYFWYYGTLVTFQMGGQYWAKWNPAMRSMLVSKQARKGDDRGSWEPVGFDGRLGGRVYATAMNVLDLEAYYRYLPIYRLQSAIAVDVLKPDLFDPLGRVQGDVLRLLISIGPAAVDPLAAAAERCSEQTKARIVRFLCSVPMTPKVEQALLARLDDPSRFIRTQAASRLAERQCAAAVGPLCQLAADPNPFIRSQVIDALGRYDSHAALAALVAGLGDAKVFIAKKALAALMRHSGGQDFGFDPSAPPESRRNAAARWRQWLDERQQHAKPSPAE